MIKGRNSQIAFSKTCACFKQTQNEKNTEKQLSFKQYSRLSRNNKLKTSKISLKKKKIQQRSPQNPDRKNSKLKIANSSHCQENSFNTKSFINTTCTTTVNTSRFSVRPSLTERKVYSFIPTQKITPLLSNTSINNNCERNINSYNQNSTNYQISYKPIISSVSTYKDMNSTYYNEKDLKCSIIILPPQDKDNQLKRSLCKSSNFLSTFTKQSVIQKKVDDADKQKTILETKQLSTSYIFKPNINLSNSDHENQNFMQSKNCYNIKTIQSELNQSASQYSQLANSFYQNKINKNKITGLFNTHSNQFKVHSIL